MSWVLAVLLVRGVCNNPEREEETIFVYTEEEGRIVAFVLGAAVCFL